MTTGLDPITRVKSAAAGSSVYDPRDYGVVGNGTTDDTASIQAMINAVPNSSIIEFPRDFHCKITAQILIQGRKGITIRGPSRVYNFGAPTDPSFNWAASGGTMFKLNYSQNIIIQGFRFLIAAGNTVDKFIDIDGYDASSISTANDVLYNSFTATNQNNANFKAISISATATNNNENMHIIGNTFGLSSAGLGRRITNTGSITSGTNTLTDSSIVFVAGDVGKRIRVGLAGVAGATLDTTISSFTNSTTVTLTANASSTVTGARVILGEGFGVGVYNGPSFNAKHHQILDNAFGYGAIGIENRGGGLNVRNFGLGYNDTDIVIGQNSETIVIEQIVSEGSIYAVRVEDAAGSNAPIVVRDCRLSNTNQLPEGFIIADGIFKLENSVWEATPPRGGTLFGSAGTGNLQFTSEKNNYRATAFGILRSINMVNAGFARLTDPWTSINDIGLEGSNGGIIVRPGIYETRAIMGPSSSLGFPLPGFGSIMDVSRLDASHTTAINTLKIGDSEIEVSGAFRPTIPQVTKIGTHGGSAAYDFLLVAVDASGFYSMISERGGQSSVANTLSSTNFLRLSWPAVPGAATYRIYVANPANPAGEAEFLVSGVATNTYDVIANPAAGPYFDYATLGIPGYNKGTRVNFRAPIILINELTFTASDATPSVMGANDFVTANSSATSITTFDDTVNGQLIRVRVNDANTTFVHGSGIQTRTAANVVATNGLIYQFIRRASTWYQL